MTKKTKYPTWNRIDAKLIVSEEQMDGTPDFIIEKDGVSWYVKWRTSAHWSGPYKTAAVAMRATEQEANRKPTRLLSYRARSALSSRKISR